MKSEQKTDSTMEKYTINRTGLPPIVFTGEQIASADNAIGHNGHANRWVEVKIYRSKSGKYVTSFCAFSQWDGESDHRTAASFATAAEVIEWLRIEDDGRLGAVPQEAVEKAAKVDPAFAAAWVEEVD
jgi:hypothetical protein